MKPPHPLLVVPAFCVVIVVVPWLVFALTSLIGPLFVLGCVGWCLGRVLVLGWRLGRRKEPVDVSISRRAREKARQRQPIERMQERLLQVVHGEHGEHE